MPCGPIKHRQTTRFLIYFLVAVSGAAVLAIELFGTRVLGPFYGVSLCLWSALIVVTLLSLSCGYYLGGRWADRNPSDLWSKRMDLAVRRRLLELFPGRPVIWQLPTPFSSLQQTCGIA